MSGEIFAQPHQVRSCCRQNSEHLTQTSGQAPGFAQANMVILSNKDLAFDFLLFCQRNPKPCPLIAMLEAGQYLYRSGVDSDNKSMIDVRTDLPKYR